MPKPQRRVTLRNSLLFLLSRGVAGLLFTIGIAWTAAALIGFADNLTVIVQRPNGEREWFLMTRLGTPFSVRYRSGLMLRASQYKESAQTRTPPGWAALPAPPPPPPRDTSAIPEFYEIIDGYGWPLPAIGFQFHGSGRGNATTGEVVGGIALSPWSTGAWYSPRALPLTPIWPGLVVDWLIATALVVLAWDGYPFVRRLHRAHRNRCIACGYSLRGLISSPGSPDRTCPECGHVCPPGHSA